LARINLWTFQLPALRERPEDIEPNVEYELEQFAARTGRTARMNAEAKEAYLAFATSPGAHWSGNFRDLSASVTRMATLAEGGRISEGVVAEEIQRLRGAWAGVERAEGDGVLSEVLSPTRIGELDPFDRVQLAEVVRVCRGA